MTSVSWKRVVTVVAIPCGFALVAYLFLLRHLERRKASFELKLLEAERALPDLCQALPACSGDGKKSGVSIGFRPTPPVTFYQEVTLNAYVSVKSDGESVAAVDAVRSFCDSRKGFRFGGTTAAPGAWRPPSNTKPQQDITCWVELVRRDRQ